MSWIKFDTQKKKKKPNEANLMTFLKFFKKGSNLSATVHVDNISFTSTNHQVPI